MKTQKKLLKTYFWKYQNHGSMRAKRAKKNWAFLGDLQGKTAKKWLFLKVSNRRKVDFWPARILEI